MDLDDWCMGPSLLAFGVVVAWVSLRGFREPHLIISAARREIEIRYGGLRRKQTWSFDDLANVTYRRRKEEEVLLRIAEFDPPHRLVIGLQHTDGQMVRIGTVAGKAAQRVLELIADVTGKPVSIP